MTKKHRDVEIKEFYKIVSTHNKKLLEWIRNKFPYRIPEPFLEWEKLSRVLGLSFIDDWNKVNLVQQKLDAQTILWMTSPSPEVYCIKEELIQELEKDTRNFDEIIKSLSFPKRNLLVLLPKQLIPSPGKTGAFIDYLVLNILQEGDEIPSDFFKLRHRLIETPKPETIYKLEIVWGGWDSDCNLIYSSRGIRKLGDYIPGWSEGDGERYQLALSLKNLILKLLYCLESDRVEIETEKTPVARELHKGFGKKHDLALYPYILGKDFAVKQKRNSSPHRPHVRESHQRRVRVGSRDNWHYEIREIPKSYPGYQREGLDKPID
jgi:hypothetical protein